MLAQSLSEPKNEPASPPSRWVTAPILSEADLTGTFWTFGARDERPRACFLTLAPGGLIGNHTDPNEELWQIIDGRLVFVSTRGIVSILFDAAELAGGIIVALAGRGPDAGAHELRRACHPVHPLHPSPPDAKRTARFLRSIPWPRRPNLVILRAGETSLHMNWDNDITQSERNWDLCVSYYDPDLSRLSGSPEYLTHQPEQRKFQAIHDLLFVGSPLWSYDQIWLPDDDLATTWGDINRMFHLNRAYCLDLAQPALAPRPDCFFSHAITVQQPNSILRHSNFVEIMCPLFSRRALRVCLGSFRDSHSGYGLDYLWPKLLGGAPARIAIIDQVAVLHTRPVGQNYDLRQAFEEMQSMLQSYRSGSE